GAGHGGNRAVRDRGGPMAQLLASYTTDWLDLVFRWFHVTAAIVWIGTSFYFVALDNHLREPEREEDRADGVSGESCEIHRRGRLLPGPQVLGRPPEAPQAAALVQVGGVLDVAVRVRAPVHRLLHGRPPSADRPDRGEPRAVGGDPDLDRAARGRLARLRRG